MKIKRTAGEKIFNVFNYIILAFIGIVSLYPFWYTVSMSFSTLAEASRDGLHLFPMDTTLASYKAVFENKDLYTAYGNTILRTVLGTVYSLFMQAGFAYALSRSNMPNRKFWAFVAVFTMLFNGGTIPTYLNIRNLGLLDSFWVYILPLGMNVYNMIILRNSFNAIPESLYESAKLDGAGDIRIFTQIFLPLSKAALATVVLWIAVGHWNSYMDNLLYVGDTTKKVLQMYMREIVQDNKTELILSGQMDASITDYNDETVKSATIVVSMLPILCVYPFIQKYFVKGVMLGSVKG